MNKKILKTILYSGTTVLITTAVLLLLYCMGPHSKNGYADQPLNWGYITLIHDPYTYNENGPYMSSYSAYVDTDNNCVCFHFYIEGENDIADPGESIVMKFNGNKHLAYRAPYDRFLEKENEIKAYTSQIKDESYVYTAERNDEGLTLRIICPMEEELQDPADLNSMTIGFEGIYDVAGNEITSEEGHSDWIFSENRYRNMGFDGCLISFELDELKGIRPGDTAKIYIYRIKDDVKFCSLDENSSEFRKVKDDFSIKGIDADVGWDIETDDNDEELMVITLSNIGGVISDEVAIHFPANLASAWKDGKHYRSFPYNIKLSTVEE